MLTQQSPYHQHSHTPTTPRPRSSQHQRSSSANAYRQSLPPGILLEHVRSWKQNEVAQWLKEVNCGQYADTFAENDLYGEILLDIDQDALKELSITSVGDRIKIFNAVKLLRSQCYGTPQSSSRPASRAPSTPFNNLYTSTSSLVHANTIHTSRSRPAPSPLATINQSFAIGPGPATGPAAYHPPSTATIPSIGRNNEGYFNPSNIAPRPIQTASWRDEARDMDIPKTPTTGNRPSLINGPVPPATPAGDGFIYTSEIMENCIRVSGFGRTTVTKIDGCKSSDDIMRLLFKKFPVAYETGKWGLMTKAESESSTPRFLTDNELLQMARDPRRAEKFELVLREKTSSPTNVASRPIQTPNKTPGRFMGIGRLLSASPTPEESTYTPSSTQKSGPFAPSGAFLGTPTSSTAPISQISGPLSLTPAEDNLRKPTSSRHYQVPDGGLGPGLTPPMAGRGRKGRKEKLKDYFGQRPPSELISQNLAEYFPGHEPDVLDQYAQRLSLRRSRMFPAGRLSVASTASFGSLSSVNPQAAHRSTLASLVGAEPNEEGLTSWGESILGSLSKQAPPVPPIPNVYTQDSSRPVSEAESYKNQQNIEDQLLQRYTIGKPESLKTSSTASSPLSQEDGVTEAQEILSPLPSEPRVTVDAIAIEEEQQTANRFASASDKPINWIKGKQIGAGSFGSVYLGMDSMSGLLMAVKQVELPTGATQNEERKKSMLDALQREIALLRELSHEHIVQYLGSQSDDKYLNIFLEYVPGGSVQQLLTSYGALLEPLVRSFVRQIVEGLSYLHDKGIIHRDIKGANVLVDNKGGIKISDFGISKKVEDNLLTNHRPSLTGSVFWMAPEVVQQKEYTNKADIWSLGCLVVEMFTGEHPYPTLDQMQAMYQIGIRASAPSIPEDISADAQDFLKGCFNVDHNERPSASQLLQHAFLTTPAPPLNLASNTTTGSVSITPSSSVKDDASNTTIGTSVDSKTD